MNKKVLLTIGLLEVVLTIVSLSTAKVKADCPKMKMQCGKNVYMNPEGFWVATNVGPANKTAAPGSNFWGTCGNGDECDLCPGNNLRTRCHVLYPADCSDKNPCDGLCKGWNCVLYGGPVIQADVQKLKRTRGSVSSHSPAQKKPKT